MNFQIYETSCIYDTISVPLTIENAELSTMSTSNQTVSGGGISADSSTVVYLADQDNMVELYSVPIGGGTITKLNGPLVLNGNVAAFSISGDSSTVVYLADQNTEGVFELYSVPIGGGLVEKLNGPLVLNGDVTTFSISGDSSTVVYRANQHTNTEFELYSVPIGGGLVKKLNDPLVLNGDVTTFSISGDSTRVIYMADQNTNDVFEIYSAPLDGVGVVVKLNDLPANTNVTQYVLSNATNEVIFVSDQLIVGEYNIFSVPIAGGTNTTLYNTASVVETSVNVSPDGNYITFILDSNESLNSITNSELSTPVVLSPITGINYIEEYYINNTIVVYSEYDGITGLYYVYSVSLEGPFSSRLLLFETLIFSGEIHNITLTPNFTHVLIVANMDNFSRRLLYSASIDGSSPFIELSSTVMTGVDFPPIISTDNKIVLYVADQDTIGKYELYISCIDVNGNKKISVNTVALGVITQPAISADSKYGVYLAQVNSLASQEILSVTMYSQETIRLRKDRLYRDEFYVKDGKPFCQDVDSSTTLTGLSVNYCS